jgi:predicted RNA-binding Zn-ribbon protein involved in translation (DUF1610 family)
MDSLRNPNVTSPTRCRSCGYEEVTASQRCAQCGDVTITRCYMPDCSTTDFALKEVRAVWSADQEAWARGVAAEKKFGPPMQLPIMVMPTERHPLVSNHPWKKYASAGEW